MWVCGFTCLKVLGVATSSRWQTRQSVRASGRAGLRLPGSSACLASARGTLARDGGVPASLARVHDVRVTGRTGFPTWKAIGLAMLSASAPVRKWPNSWKSLGTRRARATTKERQSREKERGHSSEVFRILGEFQHEVPLRVRWVGPDPTSRRELTATTRRSPPNRRVAWLLLVTRAQVTGRSEVFDSYNRCV